MDSEGKRIAFARNLKFPGVAGYKFEVQCFGSGHLYMPFRPPVATTSASFTATPFDIHMGLQAFDPTTLNDPDGTGWAQVSNAGCLQCVTAAGKDRGAVRGPTGISKDDPDRDGYCEEITEGDLDMCEWYLLNHPSPGPRRDHARGRARARSCSSRSAAPPATSPTGTCRPPTRLPRTTRSSTPATAASSTWRSAYNDKTERLEGKLVMLADKKGDTWIPRRKAYTVRGIYSDFKYHDVGEAFYQMQFDGTRHQASGGRCRCGASAARPPTATTAPA